LLWQEITVSAQSRNDYHYLLSYGSRAQNLSQAGLDLLSRIIGGKISLFKDTIVSMKEDCLIVLKEASGVPGSELRSSHDEPENDRIPSEQIISVNQQQQQQQQL
jgi:hypothetical protein